MMKIEKMTIESMVEAIKCGLIGKFQNQQITITGLEISFEGIVSIDNIDYDKVIVKGFLKGEKQTYELWFDRERGKFNLR